MKVSIIIPIYNVEKYIERCLLSVINQTYVNIEIILINDYTPDNSMDIVAAIIQNNDIKNAYIINHEKNKGLSGARNTGINHSTGDYLFFLDSDDELPFDAISNLVNSATEHNPDFVIGEVITTGIEMTHKIEVASITERKDIFYAYLSSRLYTMAWNKLMNKSFLLRNNLFFIEGIIHEDITWFFNVTFCADKMVACRHKTYIYHVRETSISQSVKEKNINDLISSFKYINKKLSALSSYDKAYIFSFVIMMRFYILENAAHLPYSFWKETYYKLKSIDKISNISILGQIDVTAKLKFKYILFTFSPSFFCLKFITFKR